MAPDLALPSDSDRRVDERLRRAEARARTLTSTAAPRRSRTGELDPDDFSRPGFSQTGSGAHRFAQDQFIRDELTRDEFTRDERDQDERDQDERDQDELDPDGSGSDDGRLEPSLRSLPRVPGRPRRFGRRQLLVIAVLVAAGLLLAGWAVLRARPVALATPISDPTAGSTAATSSVASPAVASSVPSASSGAAGPWSSPSQVTPSTAATTASVASAAAPANPPTTARIEVHVLGAVRRPGLQRLTIGARVADAIQAAGGTTEGAAPGRLNLAQPLGDGQQVYLARRGHGTSQIVDPTPVGANDEATPSGSSSGSSSGASPAAGSSSGSTGTVDLNQATEADLDALPGIGPVTAGKIIAWRTEHGRFSKIDELQEVDGIGPKTYADLAPHVRV